MNISQESISVPPSTVNSQRTENENTHTEHEEDTKPHFSATRKRINLIDITHFSDLEDLSVKQLKELLVANRVDFKGCCEKNELLERVNRLWKEYSQNRDSEFYYVYHDDSEDDS